MSWRPDHWDQRFLSLAEHVANWSKDPSTKVGAVIADPLCRIVSLGYNGFPRGVRDDKERLENRELKYRFVVHAERNALLFAGRPLTGCTLYTYPFQPCSQCAAMIVQAGIKRVITLNAPVEQRWVDDFTVAKTILREGGVYLDFI
jgi:dCMP deaminase